MKQSLNTITECNMNAKQLKKSYLANYQQLINILQVKTKKAPFQNGKGAFQFRKRLGYI